METIKLWARNGDAVRQAIALGELVHLSGDVLHKLLVNLENHIDLNAPLHLPPYEPNLTVKVRTRASRRAVQGTVDVDG